MLDAKSVNRFCYRISSQLQYDLLEEWGIVDTNAAHLKSAAETIGSSSLEYVEYPCKAVLNDGRILDLCILTKWTHHPLISWPSIGISKFIYAGHVTSIEPSEFALSLQNRITMRYSQIEYYRDYAPLVFLFDNEIYFQGEGGKTYYLDSNFLRYKNIKGSDIKEVNQDIVTCSKYKDKDDLKSEVTLIIFDEW